MKGLLLSMAVVVLLISATTLSASSSTAASAIASCQKTIVTANKTDMREELKKYKLTGWKPQGKMVFKKYGFWQKLVKEGCKK